LVAAPLIALGPKFLATEVEKAELAGQTFHCRPSVGNVTPAASAMTIA
jgi:hypothetical protein